MPTRRKGERRLDHAQLQERRQARGQIRHVERAGHHVEHADADHVEGGADGAHDQVVEGAGQGALVPPEADQDVGGQGRDLEKDEEVEGIAGNRDAKQAGHAKQIHDVEEVDPLFWHFLLDASLRERHDQGADASDDHQDEGAQLVDQILDAPGRRPAAEMIGDGSLIEHLDQKGDRDGEGDQGHQRGQQPGGETVAKEEADRCRHQRNDDLQNGQMR